MSIQFRSRIKSVIDYSKVLNGIGVCCDKDGNKSLKSFYDCFNDGGNYFPGTVTDLVTCPPADTEKGCCCACTFVDDLTALPYPWNFNRTEPEGTPYYESGVLCNITRCECERLKGKFTPSSESSVTLDASNISNYCYKDAPEFGVNYRIDARYPRSCCHIERDPVTGWPNLVSCDNVCTNSECASLGSVSHPSIFDDKSVCGNSLYRDNNVLGGNTVCDIPLRLSQMTVKNKTYSEYQFGSCYELVKNESNNFEYECDIKPKPLCSGYWVANDNQSEPYCDNRYTPNNLTKVGNKYDVQKMTSTEFADLNLQVGERFQGGIYIGIFKPGTPINPIGSELYGNINFDSSGYFYPDNVGVGGEHKKWAIIVDEKIYKLPFLESEKDTHYSTSLWDGYYNIYGNTKTFDGISTKLANTVKYKNRNGFIDYYLPSIHELYFYWAYLKKSLRFNTIGTYITSSIFTTKYINEKSNITQINSNGMVYGSVLTIDQAYSYQTVLVEKTRKANAIFFRKIVIED